jgi:hypothetical protein
MVKLSWLGKAGLVIVLSLAAASAGALTIGVAPAEDSAYGPPPEGPGSPVGYLVSGCMNAVFDAGHIATDSPVVLVPIEAWGKGDYGLVTAKEGLVDCVIALYASWTPSSLHKDALLLESVAYRLVRVQDGELLAEGRVDGTPDSEDASTHPQRSASRAGGEIGQRCLEKIKAIYMGGKR